MLYFLLGVCFGITLTRSQVISWFRIQEMFRFQSFHMYGIIGSAVVVAACSITLLERFQIKSLSGELISIRPKAMERGYRYPIGGILFGLGWGLSGACPGPMFALVADGISVMMVAIVSALLGTRVYGYLRPRLPH